jgi:hypothetical protein
MPPPPPLPLPPVLAEPAKEEVSSCSSRVSKAQPETTPTNTSAAPRGPKAPDRVRHGEPELVKQRIVTAEQTLPRASLLA